MLELLLIVFGVSALVAFLAGKVGYGMGAKHAAAEIAVFCEVDLAHAAFSEGRLDFVVTYSLAH